MMHSASLPPLSVTNAKHGYISGYVSYPLTTQQRNNGAFGYEVQEWSDISLAQGGASRYPLRDNHRHDVGHLLETTVRYDAAGRPMLGVSAMVDLKSDAGRRAWSDVESGRYKHFSWKFQAYEPDEPTSRRYKNKLVEVSLTDDPVKDEACVLVVCSKHARTEEANETTMSSATAADTELAAATITTAAAAAATTEDAAPVVAAVTKTTASTPTQQLQQQHQAVPATAPPTDATNDVLGFVKTSRNLNAEELVKLAAAKYQQAEEATRRALELERQNKELAEKAEELKKIRAAEQEAIVQKHREQANTVLPLLKEAGMNVDDPGQKQLINELVNSPHCSQWWAALDKFARNSLEAQEKLRKAEEERKHAEEERKRVNEEAARAHHYLNLLQPSVETLTQTAMRAGTKRGATTVQCSNAKKPLEESTASLLGLDKLDRTAFDNARATTAATTTTKNTLVPTATTVVCSTPAAAAAAGRGGGAQETSAATAQSVVDSSNEQDVEIRLPDNLADKYDMLRNMLFNEAQGVHYPIPVACSKEENEVINFAETRTLLARIPNMPWQFARWIGTAGEREQIRKIVDGWGGYWQPFNYDDKGQRRYAGSDMVEERRPNQLKSWVPPQFIGGLGSAY